MLGKLAWCDGGVLLAWWRCWWRRYGEVARQRLDQAIIYFFQCFRKVYIGEQVRAIRGPRRFPFFLSPRAVRLSAAFSQQSCPSAGSRRRFSTPPPPRQSHTAERTRARAGGPAPLPARVRANVDSHAQCRLAPRPRCAPAPRACVGAHRAGDAQHQGVRAAVGAAGPGGPLGAAVRHAGQTGQEPHRLRPGAGGWMEAPGLVPGLFLHPQAGKWGRPCSLWPALPRTRGQSAPRCGRWNEAPASSYLFLGQRTPGRRGARSRGGTLQRFASGSPGPAEDATRQRVPAPWSTPRLRRAPPLRLLLCAGGAAHTRHAHALPGERCRRRRAAACTPRPAPRCAHAALRAGSTRRPRVAVHTPSAKCCCCRCVGGCRAPAGPGGGLHERQAAHQARVLRLHAGAPHVRVLRLPGRARQLVQQVGRGRSAVCGARDAEASASRRA